MSNHPTRRIMSLSRLALIGMALLLIKGSPAASVKEEAGGVRVNTTKNNSITAAQLDDMKTLPKPKERIVGGTTVQEGAYPFMVQWMKGCGGSLIHDDIVLTAGHCLSKVQDLWYDLYIGGHASGTGQKRTIVNHISHPRYDFKNEKAYDFLLLKLNAPVDNPQLIQLNPNPNYPSRNEVFTVIGFGHTREDGKNADKLQQVQIPHIPDCSPYYRGVNPDIAFCGGHEQGGLDSCQADSGGALFHPGNNLQVGLVSWGRGCGRVASPGVYAKVSSAYSWIQHQVCELSAVPPAHCIEIRVEITMDFYPGETEWALLDQYGQEMIVVPRGSVETKGLTTRLLKVPAGSYRFYMNDYDGVCCEFGMGGIVIFDGDTNQELLRHDGVFEKELLLDLNVEALVSSQLEEDTTTAAPIQSDLVKPVTPSLPQASSSISSLEIMKSSVRVEIFYDMHPTETGWFLVNTDTNNEVYASEYDSNNRIPANDDKALALVVEEFEDLQAGNYWLVVADAAQNGICCELGKGYVRIVQIIFFESSPIAEERNDNEANNVVLEERVLWNHSGDFSAFAEAHFVI